MKAPSSQEQKAGLGQAGAGSLPWLSHGVAFLTTDSTGLDGSNNTALK